MSFTASGRNESVARTARVSGYCFVLLFSILLSLSISSSALAQQNEIVIQRGHANTIRAISFSRDGKYLLSGSEEGVLILWEVSAGRELRRFEGHDGGISSVAFSKDGKTFVSGDDVGTVRLWNVASGKSLHVLSTELERVRSVVLSSDAKMIIAGTSDFDNKVGHVWVWNAQSGKFVRFLGGADLMVSSVDISSDGNTIAMRGSIDSIGSKATIKLWNAHSGGLICEFPGQEGSGGSVALNSDGRWLASTEEGKSGGIKLWDVSQRRLSRSIAEGERYVTAFGERDIRFINNDTQIISKNLLIDVATDKVSKFSKSMDASDWKGENRASIVEGNPSDENLVRDTIELFGPQSRKPFRTLKGNSASATSLAFSLDQTRLIVGRGEKEAMIWDFKMGTPISSSTDMNGDIAVSPDGKLFASSGYNEGVNIQVWDAHSGKLIQTVDTQGMYARMLFQTISFSPDSTEIVTSYWFPGSGNASGRYGAVLTWDAKTGDLFEELDEEAVAAAYSPDNRMVAMLEWNYKLPKLFKIKVFDVVTGGLLCRIRTIDAGTDEYDRNGNGQILFSPDNRTLALTSNSGTTLWNAKTGKRLRRFEADTMGFSPNGKLIVSPGSDNTILLLNATTGRIERTLSGHTSPLTSAIFSRDGKMLVSGSADTSIKLWSLENGHELATLVSLDDNSWLVTTPDGLFDGSPAAWNKVIWRLNGNTFRYTPVEAYFGDYFYPGLLADIFAGKRPKAQSDIQQRDRRQPKVGFVPITDMATDALVYTRTIALRIDVSEAAPDAEHSNGSGVKDVRLFRNGSLVKVWHGDVLNGQSSVTLEATIPIVAGENRLVAYGFNRDNIKSTDATTVVKGAESLTVAGTLYILNIGVNHYKTSGYDLQFAVADVDAIGTELKNRQDLLRDYAETRIISLTDEQATRDNVLLALRRFAEGQEVSAPSNASPEFKEELKNIKDLQPEDALLIYFAGHGMVEGDRFYLMAHDFASGIKDPREAKTVSDIELNEALEPVGAGKLLMVIDACHSGQALGGEKEGRGPMNSKGLAQLAYDKGMYILTAAQSYQAAKEMSRSLAGQKIEHGLLTFALLEGLSKARKDDEGKISEREWMNYAVEQVPLIQLEETGKRSTAKGKGSKSQDRTAIPVTRRNNTYEPGVQRPRVFYRREPETKPLIVARP